jgi:hypothetical protein
MSGSIERRYAFVSREWRRSEYGCVIDPVSALRLADLDSRWWQERVGQFCDNRVRKLARAGGFKL